MTTVLNLASVGRGVGGGERIGAGLFLSCHAHPSHELFARGVSTAMVREC